jgi:transposase-like protein
MFSVSKLTSERKSERFIAEVVFGKRILCFKCKSKLLRHKKYYWCPLCRKKWRLRTLIGFPRSKLSYKKILVLIIAWQKKVSPGSVKHLKGISYTAISRWNTRFRKSLPRYQDLLKGIVEIDEAFFGRQKFNNQKIVIGAIERGEKHLKLSEIPDREQDSIEYFLCKNIDTESYLHSDCMASYYDLYWNGFGHELHNHSIGHFRGTNRIENVWSVSKRHIKRSYGQLRTNKLDEMMLEWEARYNFPELFKNPLTYIKGVLVPY